MSGPDGRVNDAIQSLARISQASSRLMARMHRLDSMRDPDEEIDHMRANLDHVARLVQEATDDRS